jgi:hypothetical protein
MAELESFAESHRPQSDRDPAPQPIRGVAGAVDTPVVEVLGAIRDELKRNAAALAELSRRDRTGERGPPAAAASVLDLNPAAIASVTKAIEAQDRSVRKRYLLKTPEDILAEFGRPTEIYKNDCALTWNYDGDGDGSNELTVFIQSGYVFDIQ